VVDYILPQVLEFEDMHYIQRRRDEAERSKNLALLNQILSEVYSKPATGDKQATKVTPGVVKLDATILVPTHPLFKRLSLIGVKEILLYSLLLRVKKGHTIFKEGEAAGSASFIVLYGKFLLHSERLGPVGSVGPGDSLGEEGLLDRKRSS
jgi:hypothetical protein